MADFSICSAGRWQALCMRGFGWFVNQALSSNACCSCCACVYFMSAALPVPLAVYLPPNTMRPPRAPGRWVGLDCDFGAAGLVAG